MRKSLLAATVSTAALALSWSQPLVAQSDVDQQLGSVHFQTSCNEVAQRRFDRAMRYQHSYWYLPAKEVFEEALKADPTCAIAQWGIALTLLDNPHNAIPRSNLAPGLAAIQKAKAMGAKTERERDYIDALLLMYADHDKLSHVQRIRAFRDAQEKIAAKYPDDDEAQIAYAITLNTSADLNDKTYAQQTKGAAILEPISQRLPRHPGVTHYLIHLYDYAETAAKGLDAANRYAKVAPAAPHAQHMPSHIYTRVGYWKESIDSNIASVKAAKAEKSVGNYLHAQDYMVYAHLQLGQDKQARAVMDEMMQESDFKATVLGAHYALAASPARYAVERGDWNGASQLSVRPTPFNFVMAISHFARALGAARSGNPNAAKADIEKLAELRDKLREAKDAYWAEIVDIQRQVAAAWVLHAEGKYDEALKAMSAAADAEDAARSRHGKRGARGLRGNQGEGAEPLPGLSGRRPGRRKARRQGCREGQLREAPRAHGRLEFRPAGARRRPQVCSDQLAAPGHCRRDETEHHPGRCDRLRVGRSARHPAGVD